MTLEALIAALHELKGSGQWSVLAKQSGVDYTTISRISRGEMKNPGILTVEKLATAIQQMRQKPKAKRKADVYQRQDGTVVSDERRPESAREWIPPRRRANDKPSA